MLRKIRTIGENGKRWVPTIFWGGNRKPPSGQKTEPIWSQESPVGVTGNIPLNPDEIFADMTTCDLEKVFDMKKKRYQRRGSSGYWQTDRVTDDEKRAYAKRMGFAPALLHKTL